MGNLAVARGLVKRSAGVDSVTKRLDTILTTRVEKELNALRDQASALAPRLGMQHELKRVREIISRLLTTHPTPGLLREPNRVSPH